MWALYVLSQSKKAKLLIFEMAGQQQFGQSMVPSSTVDRLATVTGRPKAESDEASRLCARPSATRQHCPHSGASDVAGYVGSQ